MVRLTCCKSVGVTEVTGVVVVVKEAFSVLRARGELTPLIFDVVADLRLASSTVDGNRSLLLVFSLQSRYGGTVMPFMLHFYAHTNSNSLHGKAFKSVVKYKSSVGMMI